MHAYTELKALLSWLEEKGNSKKKKHRKTIFKVECLKKNLFLLEREKKIAIVLLAGSVGNVSKKHNWINYIFIFLHPFKSENRHFTVVFYPSGLYEKLQDYQNALDASLGITCHLY